MRVITVGRRPCVRGSVAQNMIDFETGALNIDGTRVPFTSSADEVETKTKNRHADFGSDEQSASSPVYGDLSGVIARNYDPTGRWPANLVFEHSSGCTPEGSCLARCPVPYVDDQSGISVSTGGRSYQNTNDMYSGGWADKGRGIPVDPGYGDVGGASRYFKQFRGASMTSVSGVPQELLDYLYKLITPTQVGGESLIALDIEAVDWASIPDGKYHGVIARGEPTPEQVVHLWRIVRPGAHVLLIAPESRPTGHIGACALEDHGFEIRDSILWVREAGHVHYVPKAGTKERNMGCEALAAKRAGTPVYVLAEDSSEEVLAEVVEALTESGVPTDDVEGLLESGIEKGRIPESIRHYFEKREGGRYGNHHPTCKPVGVMERLLADVPEGATVLDPFMGSGTTGIACLRTGHDFIGIDREPEYVEVADARIRHADTARAAWAPATIVSEAPPPPALPEAEGGIFDLLG